jgi:hypothetical protein
MHSRVPREAARGPTFRETPQLFTGKPYYRDLGNLTYVGWEHRRPSSLQGSQAWPSLATVPSPSILPVQRQHLTVPPQSQVSSRPPAEAAPEVEGGTASRWHVPVDHPIRADLRHRTHPVSGLAAGGDSQPNATGLRFAASRWWGGAVMAGPGDGRAAGEGRGIRVIITTTAIAALLLVVAVFTGNGAAAIAAAGAIGTVLVAASLTGSRVLGSWLDQRRGGQSGSPPRSRPAPAGTASAGPAGQLPPGSRGQQHTAEAARSHLAHPRSPGSRSAYQWRHRGHRYTIGYAGN